MGNGCTARLASAFCPLASGDNSTCVTMFRAIGSPRSVGTDGLKVQFSQGDDSITAVGWGLAPRRAELAENVAYDVAFRLERDEYRGLSRLQAKLIDFRPI